MECSTADRRFPLVSSASPYQDYFGRSGCGPNDMVQGLGGDNGPCNVESQMPSYSESIVNSRLVKKLRYERSSGDSSYNGTVLEGL